METLEVTDISILGALARHEQELLEAVQRAQIAAGLLVQQSRIEAQEILSRTEEEIARKRSEQRQKTDETCAAARRAILDEVNGGFADIQDIVRRNISSLVEELSVVVLPSGHVQGGRS